MVYFETIQGLKTVGAKTWYSFSAYGDHYLILASNSSGNKGGYSGSSLYRWQGVFTKVQSITTDGAVNWDSVVINDTTYIAVANYGEDGRTETNSNVYRLDRNGHVVSIQNISTKGASDVKFFKDGGQTYLVFANSKSNNQETVLNSKVYRWQSGRFVDQNADFETRAASGLAVFSINGDKLLAVSSFHNKVSNSFQTNSPILKWQSGSFKSYKEVSTNGPIGVQYFENGGEHYLVFGNAKGPATVHKWKTDKFELVQSLPTSSLKSVYAYNFDSKAQLCTVDNGDEVKIYTWDNNFQLQM
ncbi:leucine-rich repeat LGI family member 2, partial [Exaiptasia diaphana]|uniref:Uncharacterized protein n=1 Tax=Exaiptasia diaphana TaxID=2652724 RepID=A0A913XBL0_EXADI